jgi:hypothetical protein
LYRYVTAERHRRILRAFADFHGELVLMEHWVSLNYTALVKILKKHDKRSSLSLRSPFLVSVLQQPFYSTEVLSQLIVKVEGRFRKLSTMTGAAADAEAAAVAEAAGGAAVLVAVAAGVAASTAGRSMEDAWTHGGGGGDAAARGEGQSDSEPTSASEGYGLGELAKATKAAMEFFDGLKDSDSILRPYGDVPAGRITRPESAKRSAEEPTGGDATKKSKR